MFAIVTGVAGFIGSTLADRLLADGWRVRGVDCFTPYYGKEAKLANLASAVGKEGFEFVEADLRTSDCAALIQGADVVFHQAAQPGVRLSWSDGFRVYMEHNLLATQRLLEAIKETRSIGRIVYASSSSVYGDTAAYPTTEETTPQPFSPYGVTKLAAECLCTLYAKNWDVPAVSLRYFTVYGPRQRPDMATYRIIEAALRQSMFPLYGDGSAIRDFTYVDDVVKANLAAAAADVRPGTVMNIAGGTSCSMRQLIKLVEELVGVNVLIDHRPSQPGDVRRTGASVERATRSLKWSPYVALREGIAAQVAWHRSSSGV